MQTNTGYVAMGRPGKVLHGRAVAATSSISLLMIAEGCWRLCCDGPFTQEMGIRAQPLASPAHMRLIILDMRSLSLGSGDPLMACDALQ